MMLVVISSYPYVQFSNPTINNESNSRVTAAITGASGEFIKAKTYVGLMIILLYNFCFILLMHIRAFNDLYLTINELTQEEPYGCGVCEEVFDEEEEFLNHCVDHPVTFIASRLL